MFVLHGNVFDAVVDGDTLVSLTDFLTDVLLKDSRDTIVVMNVSTGVRFAKRAPTRHRHRGPHAGVRQGQDAGRPRAPARSRARRRR